MPSKEEKDKRSAVKNLSTYTFIQILRRYAPQNDKLLNCSQTPPQTGICNWRQRGEVKGKDRCSGRSWLAEINTGFSRASRSPALRRLAKLAPLASAREYLRHRSTASDKKPVPVSLPNQNRKLAAARATLRIAKPQNDKKRRSNNRPQTTISYQSSRAITPPADC